MDEPVERAEQQYQEDATSQEQVSTRHALSTGQPKRRWLRWLLVGAGVLIALELILIVVLTRPGILRRIPTIEELRAMLPAESHSAEGNSVAEGPLVGQPAPDFTLQTLAGEEVTLSDLRGRPVLINFWASWCPPCRQEMPELVRAYEEHAAEGFVILGLNLTFQDSLVDAEAFVEEFNVPFPIVLDETGDVTNKLYRVRGIPTSVFVARDGTVTRVHVGALSGEQIDQYVDEILK